MLMPSAEVTLRPRDKEARKRNHLFPKPSTLEVLVCKLWHRCRGRLFRAVTTRVIGKRNRILLGPMRGILFQRGTSTRLGIYELHVQYAVLRHLREGEVFYDVGAQFGYFSLLAARRVGPSGSVFVFEPLPENQGMLERIIDANELASVRLVKAAVSNATGTAVLHRPSSTAEASLVGDQEAGGLRVSTLTLDNFASRHPAPALIKVDVEGAELLVLEGATNLLRERSSVWIIESHSREMECAVTQMLNQYGYSVELLGSFQGQREDYPRHIVAQKRHYGA